MRITDYLTITRDIMQLYNRMCRPVLEKYDLPQVSFDILMFLTNNPDCSTAAQISQIRGIKKNLVSVHVDKLVEAGLLSRGSIPGDRRKILLSCTPKAAPIVADGMALQQEFFSLLTAGITPDRLEIFQQVQLQMIRNIHTEVTQNHAG